ncbi:MAG TPA: class I SAM-dependent methyltransferase [Pirellulales bacterium]|nr:class I SAM-dependent methyltransferase [Pirellulales bacterium]
MQLTAEPVSSRSDELVPARHRCRFCREPLADVFVDLGMSPLCESYLPARQLDQPETFYPLCVYVCRGCLLVQLPQYVSAAEIFSEYAYFSSYSDSWLRHARRYVDEMVDRYRLGPSSQVVEIASNDGYLLQYFVERKIPSLGIEPAANVAQAAMARGVPTVVKFFGRQTAEELVEQRVRADHLVANNVLAHVPDLNDFVAGVGVLLAPRGVATFEFPHLLRLIEGNQFDTIYHEHFSYLSFQTAERVFAAHGLVVFDVEELPTHGGSLRVFVRHADHEEMPTCTRVADLRRLEVEAGLHRLEGHRAFATQVIQTRHVLLELLIELRRQGRSVAGYGAPGKGNTLLNYCGIRADLIEYTVDRNPYKHGKFLPGTHIPVYSPDRIAQTKPDYVLILPWNLRDEIVGQLSHVRDWGGNFIVPIPRPTILE